MKRRRARLELVEDRSLKVHKTRFDEERYLSANPAVRAAVDGGITESM